MPTARVDVQDKIKAFHWPCVLDIIGTNLLHCINFVSLNLSSKNLNTHLATWVPAQKIDFHEITVRPFDSFQHTASVGLFLIVYVS